MSHTCDSCGQPLPDGTERCPFCGAVIRGGWVPHPGFPVDRRRTVLVAGVAALLVMAVAFVIAAWLSDQRLAERARAAESAASTGASVAGGSPETVSVPFSTAVGTGGGSVVSDAGLLMWTSGSGLRVLSEGDGSPAVGDADAVASVETGAASCLNAYDGNVYFLGGLSDVGASAIYVLEESVLADAADSASASDGAGDAPATGESAATPAGGSLGDASAAVASPSPLVAAGEGEDLTSLLVRNGIAFYTCATVDGVSVRALDLSGTSDPVELGFAAGPYVQLSYDADVGVLAVVSANGTEWGLRTASVRNAAALASASLADFMSGSGEVVASAYDGSTLFLSATGVDGRTKTSAYQAGGNFNEYADLADAVSIAASSQGCVVITKASGVACIDSDTNFSHDVTDKFEGLSKASMIASCALSVQDGVAYLLAGDGSLVELDLATETAKTIVEGEE